jgi:DNA-binding response OmpR family regulator
VTDTHDPAPLSVLLVGGHPGVSDSSAALLRLLGYEVRVARSGAEAVVAAGVFAPDVAVFGPGVPDADALADGLVAAWAGRPLLVALGGSTAGGSRGTGFDHVLATADPAELASLLTDYALVVER